MIILIFFGILSNRFSAFCNCSSIVWIQNKYMEAPFFRATLQVVVGGALVLAVGVLIGTG